MAGAPHRRPSLAVEAPAGSRRRGFEPFTVQDLILTPQVILFRRERWVTPDGQEITAPLPPEVTGHFGPGIVRFVLMQHIQGQVTVERLLAQLKGVGLERPDRHNPDDQQGCFPRREGRHPGGGTGDGPVGDGR